jgi:hypothetical protein
MTKATALNRITVDIPRPLYQQLKQQALREGCSVKELVLQGIEHVLNPELPKKQRQVRLPIIDSAEPGTLTLTNEQIYQTIGFP